MATVPGPKGTKTVPKVAPVGRATSVALVPVPKADDPDELTDPRRSDVDEWGRSEHMREIARRVYGPLYRSWHRVEWEGLDKIPTEGGALLVSNHAGAIPADAPAIMHGIEEDLGRPVYGMADEMFKRLPVIGTMWSRVGGVLAHPDNAYRLLREQEQLALVFPEGTKGTGKTYGERYQLRRFGRGGFVQIAMRAGVPVIPIAVVGAEEAMPILWKSNGLAKLLGIPYVPVTANMIAFAPLGLLGAALTLPSKIRIRVLDPVHFDVEPDQPRYSRSLIMEESERIRQQIQEALFDMLRQRQSVWFGRRVLITGLGTFWGSRVAQALEADPTVDVIVGLDRHEPTIPLERTEYVRSDESYSILARIVKAARIDTVIHTFLVVDSTQMRSRTIHEINVIGTMNLFAAASAPGSTVRNVVVKSSTLVYGAHPKDPVWFSEESRRALPAKAMVERSLLEVEGYVRDFAVDNPHVKVAMLRFSNVLGPDITTPLAQALELPVVPAIFGFDPRFQFVHEDDVVRAILFVLEGSVQGIYNVAGDGLVPWSEVAAICGKRTFPLPPLGLGLLAVPLTRVGLDLPPELLDLLRHGRGVDNRRLKQAGFEYHYTSAGTVADFVEAVRLRQMVGNSETAYQYERDVEQFFRHSPAVIRDSE